jgi:protein TonB
MAGIYRHEVPLQGAIANSITGAAEAWAGLDRQSRVLYAAVAASILLHAVLLSVHFKFPNALRWQSANPQLDVILVNAKSRHRPGTADALAQANLEGGGETDQDRRAKTPLPVIEPRTPGRDLAQAQRRVRELEAQQRKLLAQARKSPERVAPEAEERAHADESTPRLDGRDLAQAQRRVRELEAQQRKLLAQARKSPERVAPEAEERAHADESTPRLDGRDLADLSLAAMRLQAQIDRQVDAYQKRPRKKFIGASAVEYRFAQYEEDWRQKVERIGTVNYPAAARGKLYGNLRMTVTLRPDGNVESIELDRSSGLKVLDDAAFRIVRMASPYASFPADIRRDTDLLVITRTWFFGRGDRIWTE